MNVNGRLGTCGGGCEAPVLRDEASIRLPLSERPADGKRSRARSPPHDPGVRHRKRRFREGRRLPGEHDADPCRRSLMQLAKEQARVHESRYRMARTQVAGKCRGFEVTIASKSEATPAGKHRIGPARLHRRRAADGGPITHASVSLVAGHAATTLWPLPEPAFSEIRMLIKRAPSAGPSCGRAYRLQGCCR